MPDFARGYPRVMRFLDLHPHAAHNVRALVELTHIYLGVPILYARSGYDISGRPPGCGREQRLDYIAQRYHQPSDDFDPSWDLTGMVQDARLAFGVGLAAANASERPAWQPGDEFEAAARERTQGVSGR